jgi:hypothetical protein
MSWWQHYQAWEPERSWDRYQARRLESRAHFVATAVAVRAAIVFFMLLLTRSSVERATVITAIFVAVAGLLWWFLYYPRIKAKSQKTSASMQTTSV